MARRKDLRNTRRRKPSRSPRKSILVVCEGQKTEPAYFSFYKRQLRLSNVLLEICGDECGSDPTSVVEYAKRRFKKDRSIDVCFCVIDRDDHSNANFHKAMTIVSDIAFSDKREFSAAVSDPCIEYWYLLHFKYTRAPFVSVGGKTRAQRVADELKKIWPEYKKNLTDTGNILKDKFEVAEHNAQKSLIEAKRTGDPNPSTNLHRLVRSLLELNK